MEFFVIFLSQNYFRAIYGYSHLLSQKLNNTFNHNKAPYTYHTYNQTNITALCCKTYLQN